MELCCVHGHFNCVFVLQKIAISLLGKMNYVTLSTRLKTMSILTLASLHF